MPPRHEADVDPKLLMWARKSARMSINTAAKKIGVPSEKLIHWESGESNPTVNQLWKCATVYKRPLAAFFLPEVPPLPKDFHDFRRTAHGEDDPVSSQVEIELRRARLARETALQLSEELGEEIPQLQLHTRTNADPDKAAMKAREILGISLPSQCAWRDSRIALRHWIKAIESRGILVLQCSGISSDVMRGCSISDEPLPVILLNGGETANGRIFTLMHEFAHILIHNGGICDTVEYRGDNSSDQRVERFCNRLAAGLLVPNVSFDNDLAGSRGDSDESIQVILRSLSQKYHVSRDVILGRMYNHKFIDWPAYDRYLQILREEFLSMKRTGYIDFYNKTVRNNGISYTDVVLEAHNQGVINLGDACDLLNIKVRHLERVQSELRRVL